MTVVVRPAEAADLEAVTRLLTELGRPEVKAQDEAAAREVYLRHIERDDTESLVAVRDDVEVVGFCSLEFRDRLNRVTRQAWVPDLIVTESARSTGAGRALLSAAFDVARDHGCYELTLESGWKREVAHRFYEIAGMSRDGYYFTVRLSQGRPVPLGGHPFSGGPT
jgi:GNAT superfamily N-acetyltransferase